MILERLPRHITGFSDGSAPPSEIDPKTFKAACRLVAAMERGSVESFDLDLLSRSYYAATVRTDTDHATVLCNSIYPYVAFVPPNAFGFRDLEFVEPVSMGSLFARMTSLQPLDAAWLRGEPRKEVLADLASEELKQLIYWKSRQIGDVIFNYWD